MIKRLNNWVDAEDVLQEFCLRVLARKDQLREAERMDAWLYAVLRSTLMRHAKDKTTPMAAWIRELLERKPFRLVSVALANKLARVAWVVLTRGETYRPYRPAL